MHNNAAVQSSSGKIGARQVIDEKLTIFDQRNSSSEYTLFLMPCSKGEHECSILRRWFFQNPAYQERVGLVTVDNKFDTYTGLSTPEMLEVERDTRHCRLHIRGDVFNVYKQLARKKKMFAWLDLISGPTEITVAKILDSLQWSIDGSWVFVTFVLSSRDGREGRPWVADAGKWRDAYAFGEQSQALQAAAYTVQNSIVDQFAAMAESSGSLKRIRSITDHIYYYEHYASSKPSKVALMGFEVTTHNAITMSPVEPIAEVATLISTATAATQKSEELRRELVSEERKINESKQAFYSVIDNLLTSYEAAFGEKYPMAKHIPVIIPESYPSARKLGSKAEQRESLETCMDVIRVYLEKANEASSPPHTYAGAYKDELCTLLKSNSLNNDWANVRKKMQSLPDVFETTGEKAGTRYCLKHQHREMQ